MPLASWPNNRKVPILGLMSPTKRIVLNIAATYGRSLFGLACGIFSGRWVLQALGQNDYGLYGVVGGLTFFIAFFNSVLSSATGRYYAVSVGQAQNDQSGGIEECRRWFNASMAIHFWIPCALMAIGYPLGMYAVNHWLTIPPDRIEPCRMVFRCVCVSCFVGMINVPFTAMYTAKQYIAELSIYGVVQSTANLCMLYYMVTHAGDWLAGYALGACLISVAPQAFICIRAFFVFKECRVKIEYMGDFPRIRRLGSFAGWQLVGLLGALLRGQGVAILVNKYFTPSVNAAMSVANSVNSQMSSLSGAMVGAFSPVIITAYGAGNLDEMRKYAMRACKFGLALVLLFLLPLSCELSYVMRLWLKTPPPYTIGLCYCMMFILMFEKGTVGHYISVRASGKVAKYNLFVGGVMLMTLPLAWFFVGLGANAYFVGIAMVTTSALSSLARVFFASRLTGLSIREWVRSVLMPSVTVGVVSILLPIVIRRMLDPSFMRLVISSAVVEAVFAICSWRCLLDAEERQFVRSSLAKQFKRFSYR